MNKETVLQLAKEAGIIVGNTKIDEKKLLLFAEMLKQKIFEELQASLKRG